ncbi:MOM-2 protein [Aphelenchoides avenae]|nr:MOM-2 protein [Aphelenchus avenae]
MNWVRQPGLSDGQRRIADENPQAMRFAVGGVQLAVDTCRKQFANEKWNCTWTSNQFLEELTPEVAYLHSIISGGISHSVAQGCANGGIPDCGCGDLPDTTNTNATGFVWGGCSDNIDYANDFGREFIEAAWTTKLSVKTQLIFRDVSVGRKVLKSHMRKRCKCHGLFGACVEKTCKKVVPRFGDYAAVLLTKYRNAKKTEIPSVNPTSVDRLREGIFADKDARDLLYLHSSPDYCTTDASKGIRGTAGRECFSEKRCTKLCCGRGWNILRESRLENCNCEFVWCCEVKCESCVRTVDRMFCV